MNPIFDSNFKELASNTQNNAEIANDIEKIAKDYPDMEYGMVVIECNNKSYIYRLDIKNKTYKPIEDLVEFPKSTTKEDDDYLIIYNSDFKRIGKMGVVIIDSPIFDLWGCKLHSDANKENDKSYMFIKKPTDDMNYITMQLISIIEENYRDQEVLYLIDMYEQRNILKLNDLNKFYIKYKYYNI